MKKHLNFKIESDLWARVKKICEAEGLTFAEFLTMVIKSYMEEL